MKNQSGTGRLGMVLVVMAGLFGLACSTPLTFVKSVRMPTAEPLDMQGQRVAAVVMMEDQAIRKTAEDSMARELTDRGVKGLPMYMILPSHAAQDEAAARAAMEKAEVKGVIVMRPMRVQKQTVTQVSSHDFYAAPMYAGYWGGYYPYGWGTAWGAPVSTTRASFGAQQIAPYPDGMYDNAASREYVETETLVNVETLIYDLKQNRLIWAGNTESTPPENVDHYVMELAAALAEELGRLGLLTHPQ